MVEKSDAEYSSRFRDKMRGRLEIQPDGLDDCLIEQPVYFYDVAGEYAEAVSVRDEVKLELKEVWAELDQQLRKKNLEEREYLGRPRNERDREAKDKLPKVTETMLENQILTMPRVKELERKVLEATADAEKWLALKEAYQQRSFMLRELVSKHVAELNNLGLERTAKGARSDIVEARSRRADEASRNRPLLRPTTRS